MENKKIKAGIIGATGYAGVELVRLLSAHPHVLLESASSVSYSGEDITNIYPNLKGGSKLILKNDPDEVINSSDVVFASLPHGLSQDLAKKTIEKGSIFIDLGADFRLENEEDYINWYQGVFLDKGLHNKAVYGLSEVFRKEIKGSQLIANPGCYPTSIALALYPGLQKGAISVDDIIIDSKSGATGAGRTMTQNTHFPECNESLTAYKAEGHRHIPEIKQVLSKFAGTGVNITFIPHLVPINRGILSTIYCKYKGSSESLRLLYEETYKNEPFVTVLQTGEYANVRNVRLSNSCHISLHFDNKSDRLVICSAIDNMVKGAAGQAIQNMNIIFGLDECSGLSSIAPAF